MASDSGFAPQQQQSQVNLSSLLSLAMTQQRANRSFEQEKKEYAASQLIGRLKAYDDNPAQQQAYYQMLTQHPQAGQLFSEVGLDLTQFAPQRGTVEERIKLGSEDAAVEAGIFASEGATAKRTMEQEEEFTQFARKEVEKKANDIVFINQGFNQPFKATSRREAGLLGVPMMDESEKKLVEAARDNYQAGYNNMLNKFSQVKDLKHLSVMQLAESIAGPGSDAPEMMKKLQADYLLSTRGTEYEAQAMQELKMFRAIMNGKGLKNQVTGEEDSPEVLMEKLRNSPVMDGPSPFMFLTFIADEADTTPEGSKPGFAKGVVQNFFRNWKGGGKSEKSSFNTSKNNL